MPITRLLLFLLMMMLAARPAGAVDLEFSAFGDMSLAFTAGDPPDEEAADLFRRFGADENPVNLQRGFGVVGSDFVVLAELNEKLTFLGEINIQVDRGSASEVSLDLERVFLDYQLNNWLNIQVGEFFTPVGFFNRTLYSRAWLMTSVQVPDFAEEELGFMPTHSTGMNIYGNIAAWGMHSFNYSVSVADGRGRAPTEVLFARDPSGNKEVTALLEWLVPDYREFRIGLSGWVGKIETFRLVNFSDTVDIRDPGSVERIELREIGFDPYIAFYSEPFNLIAEYALVRHQDRLGNLGGGSFNFHGLFVEFSLNLMEGKLHPYLRYDVTDLPEKGGPYYPLRKDGDLLTRRFVPEFKAVMAGLAYDLYAYNRVKVEYTRHLDGPRPEHGLVLQTAFGF